MKTDSFAIMAANDILYQLSNLPQLTFEVTDACNLRCKYCGHGEFYDDYDKRENFSNQYLEKVRQEAQ
jgi:molybdenum cofactor biosynthesis enzyme MoaA